MIIAPLSVSRSCENPRENTKDYIPGMDSLIAQVCGIITVVILFLNRFQFGLVGDYLWVGYQLTVLFGFCSFGKVEDGFNTLLVFVNLYGLHFFFRPYVVEN